LKEKVIEKSKRFVTIAKYQEISGLSYATVSHLMNSGQLPYITTESGLRRVDTGATPDRAELIERLDRTEQILSSLCDHLGVKVVCKTGGALSRD
jgi:hypothetical protein